ncbi:MAG: O-antigen polysaccharide polymerase Wzy [Fulvivirga sp.]
MLEQQISAEETLYVILLLLLIGGILINNIFSSKYYKLWSPLTVVGLTYLYYTVAGPLLSIYMDETYIRFTEHRPYFIHSWKAAFLSLLFLVIGYWISSHNYKVKELSFSNYNISKYAAKLYIIGFAGVLLAFGFSSLASINFLSGDTLEQTAIGGGFSNYFLFMMNLFIPSAALLLVNSIKNKRYNWILFLAILYPSALYITLGFRYRVVLLILSLLATYYLYQKRRPNFIALSILGILVVTFMGIIGSTRTYYSGLKKLENLEGKSFFDMFLSGFSEAQTFQSTGLLIEDVPKAHPHIGLQPVFESLAMPIPRQFWPDKPSGESLEAIYSIYQYETGIGEVSTGAAILNYGENYLAFGWIGVIIGAFVLGIILRIAWNWFLARKDNEIAVVLIAVFNSFIYVVISRGYLPQVTINFFFTVIPVYLLYYNLKKKSKTVQ